MALVAQRPLRDREHGRRTVVVGVLDLGGRAHIDIAAQLESETAVFRLADPGSPTLVQDLGDISTLYVLMPMRV